ncbi:MAG: aminopeptidase P family protein, partial [Candidatus Dormibacteria bacterium]
MSAEQVGREDGTPAPSAQAKHDRKPPKALLDFMVTGWETNSSDPVPQISGVQLYQARRQALSEQFPGLLVVVPSGASKTRANDTEFRFRPGTD